MLIVDALIVLASALTLLCKQKFLSGAVFAFAAFHAELIQVYKAHNTWAFFYFWCIASFVGDFILALICSAKNKNFASALLFFSALISLIIYYFARDKIYIVGEWRSYVMLLLSASLMVSALREERENGGGHRRRSFNIFWFSHFWASGFQRFHILQKVSSWKQKN